MTWRTQVSPTVEEENMRIAIIGTGISGMVAAHLLAANHELTIFEAGPRIGGIV